jgi:hypothetical protein
VVVAAAQSAAGGRPGASTGGASTEVGASAGEGPSARASSSREFALVLRSIGSACDAGESAGADLDGESDEACDEVAESSPLSTSPGRLTSDGASAISVACSAASTLRSWVSWRERMSVYPVIVPASTPAAIPSAAETGKACRRAQARKFTGRTA